MLTYSHLRLKLRFGNVTIVVSTALSYLGNSLVNKNIVLFRFLRLVRPPEFESQSHHLNSVTWGMLRMFSGYNMLARLLCHFPSSCSGLGSSDRYSICCHTVWVTFTFFPPYLSPGWFPLLIFIWLQSILSSVYFSVPQRNGEGEISSVEVRYKLH